MSIPPSQYSIVITNYGVPHPLQQVSSIPPRQIIWCYGIPQQAQCEKIVFRSLILWCCNKGFLGKESVFHPNSPIDLENIDSVRIPDEVLKRVGASWFSVEEPGYGDRFEPNFLDINATYPKMYEEEEEEVSLLS